MAGERQETGLANLAPFRRTFTGSSERLFVVLFARLLVVAVAQLVPSIHFLVGAVRAVKRLIVGGVAVLICAHAFYSALFSSVAIIEQPMARYPSVAMLLD